MSEQDGIGGAESRFNVIDQDITQELRDSYLTYAMSTIMDRALPDVRDGLKPSQRRLLWSMNELNLRPSRKHVKCAKIVGDCMGNYHPHGDAALYGTMVGMAQDWKSRARLVDPQGNFGSIEGDPPAAMRYTEARMAAAAADMLADVELDAVEMQSNYDDTREEPTVMPGRFPNLLVNGGVGIAVGMATSLAPHNPTEVIDSIIRVIDDPAISLEDLMRDVTDADGEVVRRGIVGPDFPTGGTISGRRGIVEAYALGRGKVAVRGSCHVESVGKGSEREQVVIDSIPYMLMQGTLVERIVDAVKEEKIQDVADVRNESGREARTRIVVELKKGADARVVEKQLYTFTPLQGTFSISNIALVNRQPRTLSLREMIDHYVRHRTDVVRRRTSHLLREAKKKAHLQEGAIFAVCDIDEVIAIIRASRTREEAIERLMERRFRIPASHAHAARLPARLLERVRAAEALSEPGVLLSRLQAETIGAMRLIQLVGLEIEELVEEYRALTGQIEEYESILGDARRVLAVIRGECEEMRARYTVPRLTAVEEEAGDFQIAELIPHQRVAVTISRQGYIKRVPLDTYRQQGRGGKGIRAGDARDDDFIAHVFVAGTHDDLLCFTDTGRVFMIKVYEVPEMSRTAMGRAIVNLLELRGGERTCAYLNVENFEASSKFLTFASRGGIVKRTALKEYRNVNRGGIIAVGLKEGDSLLDVIITDGDDDVMLVTAEGMAIRFSEQDARLMGRSAAGVKGIELGEGDAVIGAVAVPMVKDAEGDAVTRNPALSVLTITEHGYGKRTRVDEYRVQPEAGKMRSQSRGGKGRADIKTGGRNGRSVAALLCADSDDTVVVSKGGQLVRIPASSISQIGRGTQGVRVVGLDEGDRVISAARVADSDDPAVATE
ncbi:MAG: DNA gyrase subunit A [Phycisphaerae bacterium]|nr:DNA gyrase subunit A [Phycisphaerae bacterium]